MSREPEAQGISDRPAAHTSRLICPNSKTDLPCGFFHDSNWFDLVSSVSFASCGVLTQLYGRLKRWNCYRFAVWLFTGMVNNVALKINRDPSSPSSKFLSAYSANPLVNRPKIGAVSYLNTKPLVVGLDDRATDYELLFDLPSRLADRLASGELDVALIPAIEAVAHPEYTIVSDACIGCQGPVWSVKLFSRVPAAEIRTLALDEGSRTSQALTRAFLAKKFNVFPRCETLSIDQDWRHCDCDAALVIGDRAMNAKSESFPYSLDLGTAWTCWTQKPFVFAVWAARPGSDFEGLSDLLSQARDAGQQELESIARENAARYDLSIQDCWRYLQQNIHYYLGDEEKLGMQLYFDFAAELSLIPQPASLQFYEASVS